MNKRFGEVIRLERKKLDMSLRKLAQLIKKSPGYLSLIEQNRVPPPLEDTVKDIAKILGFDQNYLLKLANRIDPEIKEYLLGQPNVTEFINITKDKLFDQIQWSKLFHFINTIESPEGKEKDIDDQNDFARTIIESANVMLIVIDCEGRILWMNRFMEDLTKYTYHEIQGSDYFSLFIPKSFSKEKKESFRKENSNVAESGSIEPILTKDGEEVLIEWHDKSIRDKNDELIGVLAIGTDVSIRVKAEEAVKNSKNLLELRVKQRTEELETSNILLKKEIDSRVAIEKLLRRKETELTAEKSQLEEINIAYKVLLKNLDEEKQELSDNLIENMNNLVFPYLDKLESAQSDQERIRILGLIQANLTSICTRTGEKKRSWEVKLTRSELAVAQLISQGLTSQEAAESLNLSIDTIGFHRNNIRKKLGIQFKKVDLVAFLRSIS
jgi:PAS domain S-box-containing protein